MVGKLGNSASPQIHALAECQVSSQSPGGPSKKRFLLPTVQLQNGALTREGKNNMVRAPAKRTSQLYFPPAGDPITEKSYV